MKLARLTAVCLGGAAAAAPTAGVLLPWYEPGGCIGLREQCMGTANLCALQDEEACLRRREPRPVRAGLRPDAEAAQVRLRVPA
ncbi:hypothetical protein CDD83_7499 [Cordyceps sp. RAO-2017]|nr:hypothetical protein CDD83_7499 [Cordyceps sp. RAO-2017]